MKQKSFANRLSWKIIGIVSAIFLVTLIVVGIVSHKIIADEATRATQYILHGTISDIEKPLSEVEISTRTVAAYMESMQDQPDALQTIAHRTVEISELINGCAILFLDADGHYAKDRASAFSYQDSTAHDFHPNDEQLQLLTELWAKQPLENKNPCWTAPYASFDSRNTLIATYCYPLMDDDLNIYAVVATDLSVDWIERKVEELRPYENSLTTIVCDENTVIGLNDTALVNQYKEAFTGDESFLAMIEDLKKDKDSIRRRVGRGNNMSFVVYGPLHNGWKLSIICPYNTVLRRSNEMHFNLFVICIIGLVILYFACRRVIRKMTLPITELSESAINMAKGNFKAQLPEITSEDEMLTLHDSFVYLQNSITDYIEELKASTAANERLESELNVARNIQMGMLRTDFPPQLYALLNPAKKVGGDLYDFVLKNDILYFAIGDVSGKGVPASLMMAITRASLRFVASLGLPMNEMMGRINNSVCEINSNGMFVTLFVGRINLKTRHMDYCNAGHNPIIVMPKEGEPYFLKAKANLVLGMFEDFAYEAESLDLLPGTRLVGYTDGVNEAEKADLSIFGNDRLMAWAHNTSMANREAPLQEKEVVESLFASVHEFVEGHPQNDDITIMSLGIS